MARAVAFLRGINLGPHHKVAMSDLRRIFTDAGADDVSTYIQSGNVVFTHARPSALAPDLERRITAEVGFAVPVIVRTSREMAAIVKRRPFPDADTDKLHVVFLAGAPPAGAFEHIDSAAFAPEEFAVHGREVYLHLPNGVGRSKLAGALDTKKVVGTMRTWKTVTKLQQMVTA